MTNQHDDSQIRAGLLSRTRDQHAHLIALLAPLSDDELIQPGVTQPDAWSVKDHLAHLTWWASRVMDVIGGASDPLDTLPTDDRSEDGINAALYALNRGRSLAEVRAAFGSCHERLLRFIATVPDDKLAEHYGWISGNADEHYAEHVRMIEAWRTRQG
jgi:hypothetical protein